MRIAVLSDIHGYTPALQAVLDDIDRSAVDQIIIAGDLCEGGPDPAGVIRLIRDHDCRCVYGNTDRNLVDTERKGGEGYLWSRDQLGSAGLDFLKSLPFSIRVPHPAESASSAAELLIVHANPTDVDRHLSPNARNDEVLDIIGDESAGMIAFGHLHVSYVRHVADKTLVDVSAVGSPRDGDLRPRYVVFEPGDGASWDYSYHYVEYPLEETEAMMQGSGMPNPERALERLLSARYKRPI